MGRKRKKLYEVLTEGEKTLIAQEYIGKVMEKKGITPDLLVDKLKEELEAHDTKCFGAKGEILYSEPLIAWDVRQKARQDAHKLRGDFPEERPGPEAGELIINFGRPRSNKKGGGMRIKIDA